MPEIGLFLTSVGGGTGHIVLAERWRSGGGHLAGWLEDGLACGWRTGGGLAGSSEVHMHMHMQCVHQAHVHTHGGVCNNTNMPYMHMHHILRLRTPWFGEYLHLPSIYTSTHQSRRWRARPRTTTIPPSAARPAAMLALGALA